MMSLVLSGTLLVLGFYFFEQYNFTPGDQVAAPERFPASVNSTFLDKQVPTLLVFAHPKCTCTQATLAELEKLKSKLGAQVAVKVFISYDPQDAFEGQAIEKQARTIANVEVEKDLNRKVAKTFGALTSGQTMLYAPEGNLLFQGGITDSRGHQGDNPGAQQIARIVTGPFIKSAFARTPTFGCHL
ncbi:redoxin domain-containing protein [Bdellovibrio sp. NC01]|uniref:redoxin domain-containing protein n=1 Tax=Bdellovibrio sp. NC01 TaxID=2220073 RepID=UPI00143D8B46|nr:redoxin domain-containing protein [Bdellovibrio sp. NC01]